MVALSASARSLALAIDELKSRRLSTVLLMIAEWAS
jgi:hypothetical protein